jgi:hypothetical protein
VYAVIGDCKSTSGAGQWEMNGKEKSHISFLKFMGQLILITLLQKFYETGVDDFGFLKHIGEVIYLLLISEFMQSSC